jgi:hypothetical protein
LWLRIFPFSWIIAMEKLSADNFRLRTWLVSFLTACSPRVDEIGEIPRTTDIVASVKSAGWIRRVSVALN